MTLRSDLIPTVDSVRQISTDLGLRPTRVYVVRRTRANANAVWVETLTEITPRPKVKLGAAGKTAIVGPISKTYSETVLNPATPNNAALVFRLVGEVSGDWVSEDLATDRIFRDTLVLRRVDPRGQPAPVG